MEIVMILVLLDALMACHYFRIRVPVDVHAAVLIHTYIHII